MESRSNEGQLMLAIQAIDKNPELSIRATAKIYGVSRNTLKRRLDHTRSRQDTMPNCRKLTDLEECTIIQYILDLDSRSFPPRLRGVEDMANRLLADRDAPPVGINWASKFVKRHQELSTRFTRRYDYQRAQCEDPDVIRGWFQLVRDTIAEYGIHDADIYNFDETGFAMGMISTTMVVTSSERRGRPRLAQPGNREWVSVIQGINSQGWTIPPFIIVAGKHHLTNWYEDSMLPPDWVIATTHNGWTTNEKGVEWIQHFEKHTKLRPRGTYRLLIMDGHESHHSTEFELFCKKHKIITLCMPAHSSHILQPLDVGCFGPLKKAYGREIEGLMKAHITHITKADFLPAFFTAFQAAMTEKNIKGGFRGAGLVPIDPENVLLRLDVKLRTPSPAEGIAELPNDWVPKTPNNPTEATSQTDYIKRRVSRHQGSSPTTILAAIDQVAKGACGIMHKMALLQAEVEQLREANATLSKRRRARKTRLRQGGSMTISEGQALQDQKDIEQQLERDIHPSRGRKPRDGTKSRRCGTCGKSGHNARTCQMTVEASNEEDSGKD